MTTATGIPSTATISLNRCDLGHTDIELYQLAWGAFEVSIIRRDGTGAESVQTFDYGDDQTGAERFVRGLIGRALNGLVLGV